MICHFFCFVHPNSSETIQFLEIELRFELNLVRRCRDACPAVLVFIFVEAETIFNQIEGSIQTDCFGGKFFKNDR